MTDDPTAQRSERARRLTSMLEEAGRRGHDELTRPGGLGDTAHGAFRRWCQRVWRSRGGGLYAVGFIVSFAYLETVDILFDDIPKLFAIDWFSGDAFRFAVEFLIDTFKNMLNAFLWPVHVIGWQAPAGIVILVAMYIAWPRFVQQPIEHWLFEGKGAPDLKAEKAERKRREKAEKKSRKAEKS